MFALTKYDRLWWLCSVRLRFELEFDKITVRLHKCNDVFDRRSDFLWLHFVDWDRMSGIESISMRLIADHDMFNDRRRLLRIWITNLIEEFRLNLKNAKYRSRHELINEFHETSTFTICMLTKANTILQIMIAWIITLSRRTSSRHFSNNHFTHQVEN